MKYKFSFKFILPVVLPLLASCVSGNAHFSPSGGDTLTLDFAENLTLIRFDGYTEAVIRNPWDTTKVLNRYFLVEDSCVEIPKRNDGTFVSVPLKNALVYSSVHNSLIAELGEIDAIGGVCDSKYIHHPELIRRIKTGHVADCGNGMSPNIERIIGMMPDAIMLSPFENSGSYGKLGQLDIPIIECADYMETSPLARAEWMKFYGMLFGRTKEANEMFDRTKKEYTDLRNSVINSSDKPKVLIDRLYGVAWHVPGRRSTMGMFISDAGGINPFNEYDRSGSVGLSGEEVLFKGGDADIWLVRYSQDHDKTMRELSSDNAIYRQIKAFKDNNVFGCNTSKVKFYEEVPFHPQWLLRDLIRIFHDKCDSTDMKYFTPLDR